MSRTYRSNPAANITYDYDVAFEINNEWYTYTWPLRGRLSKGGWKEAKRRLTKEEYAEQRKLRGDKMTKSYWAGGVPWWFRNELEKQHRQHTARELHRFMRNSEYEPMVCEEPSGDEWWYW